MVTTVERVLLNAGAGVSFEQLMDCHDEDKLEVHVLHHTLSLADCTHVCRLDESDNRLACLIYSLAFEHPALPQIHSKMQFNILGDCAACMLRYIHDRTQLLQSLELSYDADSVQDFVKILQEHELTRLSHAVQNNTQTRHIDLLCIPPSWLSVPESSEPDDVALEERQIINAYLHHENKIFEDSATALRLNISATDKLTLGKYLMCQLMDDLTARFARTYICLCPPTLWQREEGSSWRDALVAVIASYLNSKPSKNDIKLAIRALTSIFQLQILKIESPITGLLVTNVLQMITHLCPPDDLNDVLLISVFLRSTACEHKFWTNRPT